MAGGKAFKSNVRERREAERRMKALEKRQKKDEKRDHQTTHATTSIRRCRHDHPYRHAGATLYSMPPPGAGVTTVTGTAPAVGPSRGLIDVSAGGA